MLQNKLFKQSSVYVGGHVLARGLNFIIQVTLWSNIFNPADYGQIAYCYVFISFMSVILPVGLDAALMNYYVRGRDRSKYLSNSFVMILTILLVVMAIFLIFARQIAPVAIRQNNMILYYLSLAILSLDILNNQGMMILRAREKSVVYAGLSIGEILIRFGLLLSLVLMRQPKILFVLWANVGSSLALLVVLLHQILPEINLKTVSPKVMRMLVIFGLPFFVSGLFERTIELADRRLVGHFLGKEAVGLYVACYTIGSVIRMIIIGFNAGWHPYFLKKIDEPEGRNDLNRVNSIVMYGLIFLWFIASVWMSDFIRIPLGNGKAVLNSAYWRGETIIPVIMGAYVMMGIYMLQMPGIYHSHKTRRIAVFQGVGASVNIILNFVFIPILGIMGAALATFVSYFLMALLIFIFNARHYPINSGSLKIILTMLISVFIYYMSTTLSMMTGGKFIMSLSYALVIYMLAPVRLRSLINKNQ